MRIEEGIKLDFNDVLIVPKRSLGESRKDVSLSRDFRFLHTKQLYNCGIPIIAANFDTVATFAMAESLSKLNGWTCLNKHYSLEELIEFNIKTRLILGFDLSTFCPAKTFWTMGISDKDFEKINKFKKNGCYPQCICVDVANGYTELFVNKVREVRKLTPQSIIMAGNVATPEMVQELLIAGADIVKIGIGPGLVCETRKVTGVGYPQLSAIIECADAAHGMNGHICADGGCRDSSDVVKAFAAGADFVMLGGMFAGCDECNGEWNYTRNMIPSKSQLCDNNFFEYEKKSLKFYGMSSEQANDKYNGGLGDYKSAEGKCIEVPYKGPVEKVFNQICGGIRSACTYVGCDKLKDLSKCTTFVRVNRVHS